MSRVLVAMFLVACLGIGGSGCGESNMKRLEGALLIKVINAAEPASFVQVATRHGEAELQLGNADIKGSEAQLEVNHLRPGQWSIEVFVLDTQDHRLQSVVVSNILIISGETTEVVVDLGSKPPACGLSSAAPLCQECQDGEWAQVTDDSRCPVITCAAFAWAELRGDNSAAGTSTCVRGQAPEVTSNRCDPAGQCRTASAELCATTEQVVAEAGLCQTILPCTLAEATVRVSPDGTPCGVDLYCLAGQCLPLPPECDGDDAPALCTVCQEGEWVPADDDVRCGVIDCGPFEWFELRGDNSAAGESWCIHGVARDVTDHRCAGPELCLAASEALCPTGEQTAATAGLCHTLAGCETGAPVVEQSPDQTPCGGDKICQQGNCVLPEAEAGCADGAREGFLSLDQYPAIAACSGAWAIGGVTRPDLAPVCGNLAGDDSANPEGTGCSAADLCAAGWHVCRGRLEVTTFAPGGCADAVPPGAPDKSLFFAVSQNSAGLSVCDQSDQGNDVFGCGNLGALLAADKNCAPLNRVLASMQAGTCGFNEAEPPLGPWQCLGGSDSHLKEGALVRKNGCAAASCQYDGQPVDSADRGGVLCCRGQ